VKKLILSLVLGLIVIPVSVVGVMYSLHKSGFFNLDKIQIVVENSEGQSHFIKPLVRDLDHEINSYRGVSLWQLDLNKIAAQVSAHPWVQHVALARRWPAQLEIMVVPREVKLLFVNSDGSLSPIVEDGSFLPAVSAKEAPDVSLLEGKIFLRDLKLRRQAVAIISAIPKEGRFSRKTISEVSYNSKEGFWTTLIQTGLRVKLGEENIPLKAARVGQVLEYMETRDLQARVIDADLSKKVLVRLRKGP
jgi:cell division protein FtsQ